MRTQRLIVYYIRIFNISYIWTNYFSKLVLYLLNFKIRQKKKNFEINKLNLSNMQFIKFSNFDKNVIIVHTQKKNINSI